MAVPLDLIKDLPLNIQIAETQAFAFLRYSQSRRRRLMNYYQSILDPTQGQSFNLDQIPWYIPNVHVGAELSMLIE